MVKMMLQEDGVGVDEEAAYAEGSNSDALKSAIERRIEGRRIEGRRAK